MTDKKKDTKKKAPKKKSSKIDEPLTTADLDKEKSPEVPDHAPMGIPVAEIGPDHPLAAILQRASDQVVAGMLDADEIEIRSRALQIAASAHHGDKPENVAEAAETYYRFLRGQDKATLTEVEGDGK